MAYIFVYNAESGALNAVIDYGHKTFKPDTYPCSLCALTYGNLGMKKKWKQFIDNSKNEFKFLHKDQFEYIHPDLKLEYPVLIEEGSNPRLVVSKRDFDECSGIEGLIELVNSKINETGE